jgi:hypothetical protein
VACLQLNRSNACVPCTSQQQSKSSTSVTSITYVNKQPSSIFFLTCQLHTTQLIYDDQPLLSENCSLASDIPYFLICCSIPTPNCHNSFSHSKISTKNNTVIFPLNKNHCCNNNGSQRFLKLSLLLLWCRVYGFSFKIPAAQ